MEDRDFFVLKNLKLRNRDALFKINTDGILLAAWVNLLSASDILEIGTGTGVIAAILAKKNPEASFLAIDIDEDTIQEARLNMSLNNITSVDCQLLPFQALIEQGIDRFDHIVSNPPYYESHSSPKKQGLKVAKHNAELKHEDIVAGASKILRNTGSLSVILPIGASYHFENLAGQLGLKMARELLVSGRKDKPPIRRLMTLTRHEITDCVTEQIYMFEDANRTKSKEYQSLVGEYYL